MKRGDVLTVVVSGDYGKPRPAVVVQSDSFSATDSVLVAPLTSMVQAAPIYRLMIEPSDANGLKRLSQVMVEKVFALPRSKCGPVVGPIDEATMGALDRLLSAILGLTP